MPYDANGQWVDSTYDAGNASTSDVVAPPPTDDERLAVQNERYLAARSTAERLQSMQRRQAQSDMPAGSPTQYLDRGGAPLGPIQRDEFNIPKPPPLAATGLRGYPTGDETRQAILNYNRDQQATPTSSMRLPYWSGNGDWGRRNSVERISQDEGGFHVGAPATPMSQIDSDVNAVVGGYSAAPKFQMPTTDQLIDTGIAARRSQLENEINTRKVHLGLLPPSAIGAVATTLDSEQPSVTGVGRHGQVRYGGSKADQTRAELALLSHSATQLDRAQQENIRNNATLAIASAKQNEIAAQDTARAQVVHFMSNIDDQRYPHGSPDREAFIGKVFGSRPDWLHVMAKDKDLAKFVQDHVETQTSVGATLKALQEQYPNTQFTPSITSKGAVSYRGSVAPASKEQDKLAAFLHKQTGLTPEEFAAIDPSQVKAGGIFVPSPTTKGDGTFYHAGGGFNANGTAKGEFNDDFRNAIPGFDKKSQTSPTPEQEKAARDLIGQGSAIQIDTGKGYKAVIPRALYQRYLSEFGSDRTPSPAGSNKMTLDEYRKSIGLDQQ